MVGGEAEEKVKGTAFYPLNVFLMLFILHTRAALGSTAPKRPSNKKLNVKHSSEPGTPGHGGDGTTGGATHATGPTGDPQPHPCAPKPAVMEAK